jgi:predicted 3-demethylubiquinone-9 3-methyltransferase (glyoxalase superfamily)
MSKITPFLWFDKEAEEAAKFYTSIFKDSKLGGISRYSEGGPMPKGTAMTVSFTLEGTHFTAMNAGPHFKFNEAISFVIDCKSQEEVDYFWEKLTSDGGQESQCGWCKDKFGLSWQVTPSRLIELVQDKNPAKAQAAFGAMMKMKKIDIKTLEEAAAKA